MNALLIIVVDPYCRFRCCSFAAAVAAISLSSIADAPTVAADRSTAVVAAAAVVGIVAATDPEL